MAPDLEVEHRPALHPGRRQPEVRRSLIYNSGTLLLRPDLASTTTVAAATTYHVVGTYDGANLRIYVNGVLDGTPPARARSTTPPSAESWPEAAGAPCPAPPSKGASTRSPSTEPHSAPPESKRITTPGSSPS